MQHEDELIASYMTVLNEGVDELTNTKSAEVKGSTVKPSKDPAFGTFKKGNDADENVDLDKPSDDKELSANVKDGEPKKLKESKNTFKNPFDELYNKIVSENSFGFSTDDENEIEPSDEGDAFGGGSEDLGEVQDDLGSELGEDEGLEDELGGDIEDLEDVEGDEEIDLGVLVSTLKDVLSQLEKIVGDEEGEEEEIDDIEDIEDEDEFGESEEDESEEDESEEDESEEDGQKNPFGESFNRKKGDKEKMKEKGKKNFVKGKFKKFEKDRGNKTDDVAEEAVKITGLKKGINLTPFKGNIKPLQSKKAEVKGNIKAAKGKAQTPSTGKGHDGVPSKLSPTAGHNLMKASSHTVSGAVKPGKGLFDQ